MADDFASLMALPEGSSGANGDGRTRFLIALPADGYDSARLAFLRASRPESPDATQPVRGDVRLVQYATAVTVEGGASSSDSRKVSQKLMRRVLPPDETFKRIKDHLENGKPLVTAADWSALEAGDEFTEPLAYDVIRFELVPWSSMPVTGTAAPTEWDDWKVPSWVDVTLRVTNRATAALLNTQDDWQGRGAQAPVLTNGTPAIYRDDREVRTYSMRLPLGSR
jgi:hypothetical protein